MDDVQNCPGGSEVNGKMREKVEKIKEQEYEADLPFISALLVTKNEQEYVELALKSLIDQTYPKNKYEIIIVDGNSTDDTLKIVTQIKRQYQTEVFSITVLNNPKQILASGWNIGIKASRGDYVVRIDAHARADADFLMMSMKTMLKTNASCVGGKLITKTLSGNNDTISKILSSPFGVGNSSFRVSDTAGYADTAVYGLYKKKVFEEVGYFNEKYIRNQDLEMHSRIKKTGGKFYFNPQIKCTYYARNTMRKMAKQAFQNGMWNMVLLKEDGMGLSIRHLVPFAFVNFLIVTGLGGIYKKPLRVMGIFAALLHLMCGFIFGIRIGAKGNEKMEMPFLFLLLHVSYGAGYFSGL